MTEYVRQFDDPHLTIKHPQHVYESTVPCPLYSTTEAKVTCQLTSNVRENFVWCEECGDNNEWTHLKKCFQSMGTNFAAVWHDTDTLNLATGRVETDAKKFKEHLHAASEEMAERLNMPVDYQPIDMTDKDALGVTDEGMDATHDRAVAEGRKDSRGRFVWTI